MSYATAARWMQDGEAHANGELTKAQRDVGAAESAAEPPCRGMDELAPDGSVRHRCNSGLHQFREFRDAVVRAKAEAQLLLVGRLGDAAKAGNATAALAILRQIAPEEWGETRTLRIEPGLGGGGGATGPPLIIMLEPSDRDARDSGEEAELDRP